MNSKRRGGFFSDVNFRLVIKFKWHFRHFCSHNFLTIILDGFENWDVFVIIITFIDYQLIIRWESAENPQRIHWQSADNQYNQLSTAQKMGPTARGKNQKTPNGVTFQQLLFMEILLLCCCKLAKKQKNSQESGFEGRKKNRIFSPQKNLAAKELV